MKEIDKSVRHWSLTGSDRFRWFDCCSTRMNDWVRTIDEVLHLVFLLKHFWSRLTKWQFFCYVSTTTHKNLNFHKILKFSITKLTQILQKFWNFLKFFIWIGFQLILYHIKMCWMVQSQLFDDEIIARWKTSLKLCWWSFRQEIIPYDKIRSLSSGLYQN